MSGCDGTFRWRSDPSISMTRRSAGSSWNMRNTSDAPDGSLRGGTRCDGLTPVLIERQIEIARRVEEVFAYVADPLNDVRWCPKVRSVKGGPERYEVVHKPVPLRPERDLVMTRVGE